MDGEKEIQGGSAGVSSCADVPVTASSTESVTAILASEVVDFKDLTPLVVDKNRQVLLSRKEPSWQTALAARNIQTFGREPSGKLIRLFGTEASGYHSKPLNDSPPAAVPNDYLPISPLSTNRKSYRTPGGRNVVFIPASHVTIQPPPMTAPPATLPPLVTMPYPPTNVLPDYSSQYTTQERPQYNSYGNPATQNYPGPNYVPAPQVITLPALDPYTTALPPADSDLEETDEAFDSECTELSCVNGQLISEDKCNSLRLRTIIQNNIVPNDAEASKRAVQSAAESETGLFFDAICGTGFFSYIAQRRGRYSLACELLRLLASMQRCFSGDLLKASKESQKGLCEQELTDFHIWHEECQPSSTRIIP
ncbi:ground-like domain protein [Ostertagia ostertagi]